MNSEREITFGLLLVQAGISILTAIGAAVAARAGFPGDAVLALIALLIATGQLAGAVLIRRGSRRAAMGIALYEGVTLFAATVGALAQAGTDSHLAPWLTNVALPGVLLALAVRQRLAPAPARTPGSAR